MGHRLSMAERVVQRFALDPNFSGVRFTLGRGARGPTVNLISLGKPVSLTEEDKGWTAEPHKLKPRQFGKLELEKRFLTDDKLPEAAPEAFKGSKSALGRLGVATVFAVGSVFVNKDFQGEGYGLALSTHDLGSLG